MTRPEQFHPHQWLAAALEDPEVNPCGWTLDPKHPEPWQAATLTHASGAAVAVHFRDGKGHFWFQPPAFPPALARVAAFPPPRAHPDPINISPSRKPKAWFADFVRRLGVPAVECFLAYRDAANKATDKALDNERFARAVADRLGIPKAQDAEAALFGAYAGRRKSGPNAQWGSVVVYVEAYARCEDVELELSNVPRDVGLELLDWLKARLESQSETGRAA